MTEFFRINVSPVSGRCFPNQLALKCNINEAYDKICRKQKEK